MNNNNRNLRSVQNNLFGNDSAPPSPESPHGTPDFIPASPPQGSIRSFQNNLFGSPTTEGSALNTPITMRQPNFGSVTPVNNRTNIITEANSPVTPTFLDMGDSPPSSPYVSSNITMPTSNVLVDIIELITEISDISTFSFFNSENEINAIKNIIIDTLKKGPYDPQKDESFNKGKYNPYQRDDDGNTILMKLIEIDETDLITYFINTGNALLTGTNKYMDTAFILCVKSGNRSLMHMIMDSGQNYNPDQVNMDNMTAFHMCCKDQYYDIASKLIDSGINNLGVQDAFGMTALMLSCLDPNCEDDFIIKLLDTGKSNSIAISSEGNTALMYCMKKPRINIALKLIDTGKSNPGVINNNFETALILACINNIYDVANKLVSLGYKSNFKAKFPGTSSDAKFYAQENGWNDIVDKITNIDNSLKKVNINNKGVSIIDPDDNDKTIAEYLGESMNNICIEVDGQYYYTKYTYIDRQFNDAQNIKYRCITSGYNTYDSLGNPQSYDYYSDKNVKKHTKYFSLASILPRQILIEEDYINELMTSNIPLNLFSLVNCGFTISGIMSENYSYGNISADHCQPDTSIDVYGIIYTSPFCGESAAKVEESAIDNSKVIIKYKNIDYPINVNDQTTIILLKQMFSQELINKGIIETEGNVKFIFGGRILSNNDQLVISLGTLPITIQAMISFPPPTTGGKRYTKKIKRQIKNKKHTKKILKKRKYTKKRVLKYKNKKRRSIKKKNKY